MSKSIVDMDAAFLTAQALCDEWEAEFVAEWTGPLILAEAVQMFLSLAPEARDALKESEPDLYRELMAQVALLGRRLGKAKASEVTEVTGSGIGGGYGPQRQE
jgi:hypothetical protein